jgi:hypothetical protein
MKIDVFTDLVFRGLNASDVLGEPTKLVAQLGHVDGVVRRKLNESRCRSHHPLPG